MSNALFIVYGLIVWCTQKNKPRTLFPDGTRRHKADAEQYTPGSSVLRSSFGFDSLYTRLENGPFADGFKSFGHVSASAAAVIQAVSDFNRSVRIQPFETEITDNGTRRVFQLDIPYSIPYPLVRVLNTTLKHFGVGLLHFRIVLRCNKELHRFICCRIKNQTLGFNCKAVLPVCNAVIIIKFQGFLPSLQALRL